VEVTSDSLVFDGRSARFVMAADVTARERAARLLERTQRMETLGQLAGGIAHDFNNLLAIILGFGELASDQVRRAAEEEPDRWAPAVESTDAIVGAARQAGELTDQLLGFARGEDVARAPLDLDAVITRLAGVLRHTLGREVTLELALAGVLPPVIANPAQIEQIIVNLAVNARDAMPDGGHVRIETSNVDLEPPPLDLPPGRYVRLRVSDSGTGMTADQRDNAFEPFFTTKASGEGTGLGLATVFDIVRRSGGSIDLYSVLGLGTTVTILLPATVDAGALAASAPVPP
jgi:hypothetical protein